MYPFSVRVLGGDKNAVEILHVTSIQVPTLFDLFQFGQILGCSLHSNIDCSKPTCDYVCVCVLCVCVCVTEEIIRAHVASLLNIE